MHSAMGLVTKAVLWVSFDRPAGIETPHMTIEEKETAPFRGNGLCWVPSLNKVSKTLHVLNPVLGNFKLREISCQYFKYSNTICTTGCQTFEVPRYL